MFIKSLKEKEKKNQLGNIENLVEFSYLYEVLLS